MTGREKTREEGITEQGEKGWHGGGVRGRGDGVGGKGIG